MLPSPIPVFLYHRVAVDGDVFTVDPGSFARHLELIANSGRTSLTMTELAQGLRGERPLPPDAVGLTFDDGYADTRATLESAAALGVKSTLYVTTGAIDTPTGITTDDLIRLAGSDFVELGSHTVTHPRLDELSTAEAADEILTSRRMLASVTGAEVHSFAYPHGAFSSRVRGLVVEAGFDSAAAVKNALSHTTDDPWAIARYTVTEATPTSQIEALLRGQGAPLAWDSERLRTRGYRLARVARRRLHGAFNGDGAASTAGHDPSTATSQSGTLGVEAPVAVAQIDIAAPDKPLRLSEGSGGRPYTGVAVLVRDRDMPVAWAVIPSPPDGVLSVDHLPPEFLMREPRPDVSERGSRLSVSVVVTTCAEAESTLSCVRSLFAAERIPDEVIVVENRPAGSAVEQTLRDALPDPPAPIRVVPEWRRGLSSARNAGLAAANSDIIAFTDDDITVDRYWVHSMVGAFERDPALSCVTGLILPLELETDAQVDFEHFSALSKGLVPRRYSIHGGAPPDIPLFPYAAGHLGSGANASFRRAALLGLGGFDPLLGTGTRTQGGEDLDIFIRLLTTGGQLAYEPSAIVWHRHPDTSEEVRARNVSYGIGFGAVACKLLISREHRAALLRLAPAAIAYWFNPRSRKNADRPRSAAGRADQARETFGVGLGLLAYARSRFFERVKPSKAGVAASNSSVTSDPHAFRPIWSGQLELTAPALPERLIGAHGDVLHSARLLVRAAGTPVGFIELSAPDGRVSVEAAVNRAESEFGESVAAQLADTAWTTAQGPKVSVVLCTHNRGEGARRTIDSLRALRYPDLEILVVDNAPTDDTTRNVVNAAAADDGRVRYVCEPLKGLSRARNRGLAEATGVIVAFTDDDVQVDELWVQGLMRGFNHRADVACVTGLVASASLEEHAEQYFDRRVWWSSSCTPRVSVAARSPGDSPFHPYASGAFGTGANFACRVDILRGLGGFDQSLGAGSPTRGGEDLDIFVRILRAGHALSYEPSALVWHHHRVNDAELRDQMYAYGLGLTAYLTKLALSPDSRQDMIRRGPGLVRHAVLLLRRSRSASSGASMGHGLARSEVRGMLAGPSAYLRAREAENEQHTAAVAH
jgi:glycosyltransferase involved in cell wall biosynthesis/peptidoglycan/xylan/chitin deacetylase (PgdA/CDA1 family)